MRQKKKEQEQRKKDADGINAAREKLANGPCIQKDLQKHLHEEAGFGKGAALKLIKRYAGRPMFWTVETGDNNAQIYRSWLPPGNL